ncbi:MAG TPA: hypothetical protein VGQ14_05400 [Candidatus Eisenbacteria bacterium]|jgi:hypothetical protein|nr:hypothetical protein [Candidatus Eisenbacteria bacterium]
MKHIQRNAVAIAAALVLGASVQSNVAAKDQAPPAPATPASNDHAGHMHPAASPASPKGAPMKGTYTTITGEVMDPACFLEAGSKSIGPGHFQCAVDCARSGQTLAIYDRQNDRIYFVAGELPGKNPNDPLMPYIHKKVDVTGAVYHRSEAWGIVIVKVAPHVEGSQSSTQGSPGSASKAYDASNQTTK